MVVSMQSLTTWNNNQWRS